MCAVPHKRRVPSQARVIPKFLVAHTTGFSQHAPRCRNRRWFVDHTNVRFCIRHRQVQELWGLGKMATIYDDSVINIGRDCGGILDTGPLHRCPADLCNHDLPTAAAQSLLKQLLACFSDFITALGGLTHVATTQPSRT